MIPLRTELMRGCWIVLATTHILITTLIASCLLGCASIQKQDATVYLPCSMDILKQQARAKELQEIVKADQAERINFEKKSAQDLQLMALHDVDRRKRVGEIYGEGCFKTAEDYAAAALVFQHGDLPDHFLTTFLWSKKAVELGDPSQKHLMALAIDRYLVSSNHKQLFGSQAMKSDQNPDSCWCLQEIESSFPDSLKKKYLDKNAQPYTKWLESLNEKRTCPIIFCEKKLLPSPQGTIPGFW